MRNCIDCNKELYGYTKALRCKTCNGKYRKGKFKHSDATKKKISNTKQQEHNNVNCLNCEVVINKRIKSRLCMKCTYEVKQHNKYANTIMNKIKFIKYKHQDDKRYYIWEVECHCGQVFEARASYIKTGKIKSCGCSHVEHCKKLGGKQKGKNNPAWIEDRTKTSLYLRGKDFHRNNKGSWQYFSRKYKINNNYMCELTREHCEYGNVDVHHINSVVTHPDLVLEESNVISVRRDIHQYYHKLYGKISTLENWNSFLCSEFIKFIKGTS